MPLTLSQIEENEQRIRKEIAEREALLNAYRLVREDITERQHEITNGQAPVAKPQPSSTGYGWITNNIRWAISNMAKNYNLRDLHHFLRERGIMVNRDAIAITLNRLRENKEITVVTPGSGRRPTLFRKP